MKQRSLRAALIVIVIGSLTCSCNVLHNTYVDLRWPPEFDRVRVGDCTLHVRAEGSGSREVVFIHGNPGRMQDFELVFEALDKRRYRALAFDRPCHGHSTAPKPQQPQEQLTLLHELLKAQGFKRPLLVGHSWGGGLAQLYAYQYPDDVAGLVLLGTEAVPDKDLQDYASGLYDHALLGWPMRLFTSFGARWFFAPDELSDAFYPADIGRIKGYDEGVAAWFYTRPSEIVASVREEKWMFRDIEQLWKVQGFKPAASGNPSYPSWLTREPIWTSPDPRWLGTPILVVSGTADCTVISAKHSAVLSHRHPRAVPVSLPNESHMLPMAQPELVTRAIEACWAWIDDPELADFGDFRLFDCTALAPRRESWTEASWRYIRSRANDTLDLLPFSVAWGWGVYAGARCTAVAGTALGWVGDTARAGWPKRGDEPDLRFGKWEEDGATGILIAWARQSEERPEFAGNNLVFFPTPSSDGLDRLHSLDVEVDVHAVAVGIRVAISPLEIGDWLLGWFTLDPRGDDAAFVDKCP